MGSLEMGVIIDVGGAGDCSACFSGFLHQSPCPHSKFYKQVEDMEG